MPCYRSKRWRQAVASCLLMLFTAGGFGAAPRAAHAESTEALETLRQIERQLLGDLGQHLTYLAFPHRVVGDLSAEGVLKLKVEVNTTDLRELEDVQELARMMAGKLAEHMRVRWPRITLAPESALVTRRPFSFTEALPVLSAPLALPPAPKRRLTIAPPRPARPRVAPVHGGLAIGGPNRAEVELRNRVQRVFQSRWILKGLTVKLPADQPRARVALRISLVSQGLAKDRQRLRRATVELSEVLKLSGPYATDEGSEIRFDLHSADGANAGGLLAFYQQGHWRIDGEEPPDEAPPAAPGPARRIEPQPNGGGLPPVTARPAVAASLPDRHSRRKQHPRPPPPPPDEEQAGAHRPVSTEDLIAVPESVVGPVGSARARSHVMFRRVAPGTYQDVGEVRTITAGTAVSIVTAQRVQATVAYSHPEQTTVLPGGTDFEQSGNAVTFSLKYQTPVVLQRHAHLAVGADFLMQSRLDEALRLPEDYAQADSFWASYNLWSSPISLLHLMIRRVGVFAQAREYTQVALAQELLAHHPVRRAYWEVVADDRVDRAFDVVGVVRAEPVAFNVGAEVALGRRAALQINVPRIFSGHYRQVQLVLSAGI